MKNARSGRVSAARDRSSARIASIPSRAPRSMKSNATSSCPIPSSELRKFISSNESPRRGSPYSWRMTGLATREFAVRRGLDREHLMRNVLGLRVFISTVAVVVATAFAVAAGYDATRIVGTAVAGVGLGLVSVQSTVAVPLFTTLRFGQTTALEMLRQAIWVGLLVILVALGAGILPLLAATVPAGALMLAATALLARRQMSMRPALRP